MAICTQASLLSVRSHSLCSTVGMAAGEAFRFQMYGAANASEVASEIRTLYEDARQTDINIYSQRIPGYERSRLWFGWPLVVSGGSRGANSSTGHRVKSLG